jgi:hypothetical protein
VARPESNGASTWKEELLAGAYRQAPSFATLVVVLALVYNWGTYVLTEGIPAHLRQIQAGYEVLEKKQAEALQHHFALHAEKLDQVNRTLQLQQQVQQQQIDLLRELVAQLKRN